MAHQPRELSALPSRQKQAASEQNEQRQQNGKNRQPPPPKLRQRQQVVGGIRELCQNFPRAGGNFSVKRDLRAVQPMTDQIRHGTVLILVRIRQQMGIKYRVHDLPQNRIAYGQGGKHHLPRAPRAEYAVPYGDQQNHAAGGQQRPVIRNFHDAKPRQQRNGYNSHQAVGHALQPLAAHAVDQAGQQQRKSP